MLLCNRGGSDDGYLQSMVSARVWVCGYMYRWGVWVSA